MALTHRLASVQDMEALSVMMDAAIGQLQKGFLTPEQIESSRCEQAAAVPLVRMAKDVSV